MSKVPLKNVTQSVLQNFFTPTPKAGASKRVLTSNTPTPTDEASASKAARLDCGDQTEKEDWGFQQVPTARPHVDLNSCITDLEYAHAVAG
ncbi:unnamed protein product [Dibothriocephalus latus]|uniref:Uncharacterized protein n=1 Tax=Dibothriocephalus latus TaxID=60516 RepID=A0A3P7NVA3_DIBLA|nr:unnamed protein product [Dibothriocephalus latus]